MPGIVYLGKIKQLQIADKQEKICSKLENETDSQILHLKNVT